MRLTCQLCTAGKRKLWPNHHGLSAIVARQRVLLILFFSPFLSPQISSRLLVAIVSRAHPHISTMNPPGRPSIDELYARRVIEGDGDIIFVSLPGVDLTESEQAAFIAKLRWFRPPGCTRIMLTGPKHEEKNHRPPRLLSMSMLSSLSYRRYPSRKSSLARAN